MACRISRPNIQEVVLEHQKGPGDEAKPAASGRAGEAWGIEALESLLFGGRLLYPSFSVRAVAFLGKDERRSDPPSEDEYVVSPEEREAIVAAFRSTFDSGGRLTPTEEGDGHYLSGEACVEASDAVKAWNGAAGGLFELLQESRSVRDAKEALKALDFLYLEVLEEGFEDLVRRTLPRGVSDGA